MQPTTYYYPDPTDLCASGVKCAGVDSSRQTHLGPDSRCSSCHARAALGALEPVCPDEDSALDELWEAFQGTEDALAACIERLWDRKFVEEREKAGKAVRT
jgi:hypothetical protein